MDKPKKLIGDITSLVILGMYLLLGSLIKYQKKPKFYNLKI